MATKKKTSKTRKKSSSSRKKWKIAGLWASTVALVLAVGMCSAFAYVYYLYEYDSKKFGELVSKTNYNGIDVSHHNGIINWERVGKNDRIQYVYIKATEGATFSDIFYSRNLRKARENGILVGSYHYLSMSSTPQAQFEHFKKHVKKEEQDLLPMIDVENLAKYKPETVRKQLRELALLFEKEYGAKPLIYACSNEYKHYLAPEFDEYPLFQAHYLTPVPSKVKPNSYALWQHTDRGLVNGIIGHVDLSRLHKGTSINDLRIPKARP